MTIRLHWTWTIPFAIALGLAAPCSAQNADRQAGARTRSPDLPLVIVVPFPPGGTADRVAKVVADSLGEALHRRVSTRNVQAGIGVGAMNEVAVVAAREIRVGYTTSTQLIEATLRNRPTSYNAMSEFDWIGIIGSFGNAVVVGPQESAATFADWLGELKLRDRPMRWGVGAPSATGTLAARFLAGTMGIDVQFVTFMAADSSYEALRKGEIDANFDGVPNALEEVSRIGGRILAVTSRERAEGLPSVPAFGDHWPGEDFSLFAALVVSAEEPEAVRGRLKSGWYGVNRAQSARHRLQEIGVNYLGLDSAEAVAYMESEFLRHAKLLTRFSKP